MDLVTLTPQLRLLLGDADQAVWTDDDLALALTTAGGYIYQAAGDLISSLAVQYAQQGKSITTDDLSINVTSRGPNLLAVAKSFYAEQAATLQQDASAFFAIVPFQSTHDQWPYPPEGTPTPWPWTPDSTYPLIGNGYLGYM